MVLRGGFCCHLSPLAARRRRGTKVIEAAFGAPQKNIIVVDASCPDTNKMSRFASYSGFFSAVAIVLLLQFGVLLQPQNEVQQHPLEVSVLRSSIHHNEQNGESPAAQAAATVKTSDVNATANVQYDESSVSSYPFPLPNNFEGPSSLPLPVQVLEKYKEWHSDEALRRDPGNRKFALSYYECPFSAGNRMHEFINDLLMSILTNRTLLWKYYDKGTCRVVRDKLPVHVNEKKQLKMCQYRNEEGDCEAILRREKWLPSYDKWKDRLDLDEPHYITDETARNNGASADELPQVVVFFPETSSIDYSRSNEVDRLLSKEWGQAAARELFSLGQNFVYGAAFRYLFDFSDSVKSSVPFSARITDSASVVVPDAVSIAVHSRHTDPRDTGCKVTRELDCLDQLIPQGRRCHVFVLSDRKCTLSSLRERLEGGDGNRTCTVHIASHSEGQSGIAEHGDFASGGYFQDLATASAGARDGLVVAHVPGKGKDRVERIRTSSALIMEVIEFHRKMEAWAKTQDLGGSEQDDSVGLYPKDMNICRYTELHSAVQMWRNDQAKNKERRGLSTQS